MAWAGLDGFGGGAFGMGLGEFFGKIIFYISRSLMQDFIA
jgi:hypothetical protein